MNGEAEHGNGASRGIDRVFVIQLAIFALATTAVNGIRPMITYRALDLGASPLQVGILAAAFSIAPVVLALLIGKWTDRIGEAWFIRAGVFTVAIGAILAATVNSLALLALSQVISGLGHVANLIAGQAMVGKRGGRDARDHRYGYYATMGSLGHLAGPLLSVWVIGVWVLGDGRNAQAPAFAVAAVATLFAFMLALRLPTGQAQGSRPTRQVPESTSGGGLMHTAWDVLRIKGVPSAMLVSMITIASVDIVIAYLPLYGEARGLSVGLVGVLLAIRAGASIAVRVFMGHLIARLGRTVLMVLCMGAAAAGVGLVPFTDSPAMLGMLMILAGVGLGLGQPMSMTWIANRSPDALLGTALGLRLTGNRSALVVIPILVGGLAGAAGVSIIFWLMALALGAGAVTGYAAPTEPGTPPESPDR